MAELTKEQKAAIDNYNDRIRKLKDFQEAVRTRPGMYIGPVGTRGFLNCCREIFQNAVDQILDPLSPGNWFHFIYDERTLEVTCIDNGSGMPADKIISMLTEAHVSKNFERKPFEYPSGLNGVGAKIVNALSTIFIVESYKYDGTAIRVEFNEGQPVSRDPVKIPNKEKRQGTKIYFIPDATVLGEMNLSWKELYKLIKIIVSMTPIGTSVDFDAIDINGKKIHETITNKDGIITDLIMKVKRPIIKPITIFNDDGYHKLNIAFCFDAGSNDSEGPHPNEHVTAFCNLCPTAAGTHIDGSIEGIVRWFTQYMNNIYLSNQTAKDKL